MQISLFLLLLSVFIQKISYEFQVIKWTFILLDFTFRKPYMDGLPYGKKLAKQQGCLA